MGKPKDCPLFLHRSGQWAKKIRYKTRYFGVDLEAALTKYHREKDDLYAGREPRVATDGKTIGWICNEFLGSKTRQLRSGELSSRTWSDYYNACERLIEFFGGSRVAADMRPEDFERYRVSLAEKLGPVSITNAIVRTRVIFKWAFDNDHLERPVRFGTGFQRPTKKVIRKAKRAGGSRLFSAADVKKLLDAATPQLRAMILLGVNCGFGQSDLANLPRSALDLANGFVDFPRPKTEVARRCPLWPETVKAVKAAIALRPEPANREDAGLVFLTHRGARWIREGRKADSQAIYFNDYIGSEFVKLSRKVGVKRRGSFYNLRHTFRTVGDAAKDQPAIDLIMGHATGSMAEEYRDEIGDDRLRAVTEHVRQWLFGKKK